MLNHTLDQIIELRLHGLKSALTEQIEQAHLYTPMSFEERLSHLIDREVIERKNRAIKRMLSAAKLKYKQAHLADLDYRSQRNLNRAQIQSLAKSQWIEQNQNLIITGATGTGKTFLACALANLAIRSGYSAFYSRVSTLLSHINILRADGSYLNWLKKLSRFRLIILDDFGLSALTGEQTQELMEIIEERAHTGSIIVTSQLPVKEWYDYFNIPTIADAIMDRLVYNAHRINLKGESMRKVLNSVSSSDTFD